MTLKSAPGLPARLDAFRRVLQLETQQGYADRAVAGGLGRFLDRWRGELTEEEADSLPPSLVAALTQRRYRDLSAEQRERWVHEALTALDDYRSAHEAAHEAAAAAPDAAPAPKRAPTRRASPPREPAPPAAAPTLDSPPTVVRGVGAGIADKLANLGVTTVRGLLRHYPARHLAITPIADLQPGHETAVVGVVWDVGRKGFGRGKATQSTEAVVGDATGNVQAVWFNQPYVARYIKAGDRVMVNGYLRGYQGRPTINASGYEVLAEDDAGLAPGSLAPVYPATKGLTQRALRRIVGNALEAWLPRLPEPLPSDVRQRLGLLPLADALSGFHRPESTEARGAARRRLAFDEVLVRQLVLLQQKLAWQAAPTVALPMHREVLRAYVDALPFTLTAAQRRSLQEVLADTALPTPAHRLLEGDVGSGKTVVALGAMLNAAAHGYQAALMAPTELLAEQHFHTLARLLERFARPINAPNRLVVYVNPMPRPLVVGLLLGSHSKRQKDALRQEAADGSVDVLVGTHTLLQEETAIPNLALAVVDEEHRFGVAQRKALTSKGLRPHLLSMSATPIPRSLALTVYGDMDVSVIDELPPGRTPVKTRWLQPHQRGQANRFLRKEVAAGHQAFVVCPIIDESEALQASAAVEEHRRLTEEEFPDLRVGLLHGRMPLAEKSAAMDRFRAGDIDILVSTPVVEVGVDVPNATVMMVEAAERFGLSGLHQLRGRVGRGDAPGFCILMAGERANDVTRARLDVLEHENDGFKVAEADLEFRGPGELAGTRQSGLPDLRLADLHDTALLTEARAEAKSLLSADPALSAHPDLADEVARLSARLAEQA